MTKLALVATLLACHAACDDRGNRSTRERCTEEELGVTRCDSDVLLECDGSFFVEKEDCAESNSTCQEVFSTVARCEPEVPPGALFDECVGEGQGTCESADLTCGAVTVLSEDPLCLHDCTSDATMCDTIQVDGNLLEGYCESGEIDEDTSFSTSPFCFWKSNRNGVCLFNDEGCADATNTCRAVVAGLNPECKLACPGNEVGTNPAVCDGQECLAAPYVEIEQDGAGDKECTTPDTPDNCSTLDGYECREVATGDTTETLCARRAGLCGNPVPAAPPFASSAELSDWLDVDENLCDLLGADQYCGADDFAGALNECVTTPFAFPLSVSCSGPTDDIGCFGVGECMTFDGSNYQCAIRANLCQRFCTGADGEDLTLNGTVNPCDTGTCQIPAEPVGLPAMQLDEVSGEVVQCDSDPGACTGGFTCDTETFSDADVCAQVRKVCGI